MINSVLTRCFTPDSCSCTCKLFFASLTILCDGNFSKRGSSLPKAYYFYIFFIVMGP